MLSRSLTAGRIGASGLMSFAMTAGTPLTVVAGLVVTGFAVTGVTGIPAAFILIGVVLGVFAVGYMAMARHIPNSGAFYSYISRGLTRPLGVGAAWLALMSYCLLNLGLYGAIGGACQQVLHVTWPWWVFAGLAWALTAVLGMLKVDLSGRLLAVLLVAEIAVILIASLADITAPATGSLALETLSPQNLFVPDAGALMALAVLGFVGFETPVVFTEEVRDARTSIPRATYATIAITAVLYTLGAWAMSVATGPTHIVAAAQSAGPDLFFTLAGDRIGQGPADIGRAVFVLGILAALISFHGTTARYAYSLGREHVLPAWLGRTSTRTGAPVTASAAQSLIALVVIVVFAFRGWDPLINLFYRGGTIGGIGVLALLALTSLAVIGFFFRTRHHGESLWATALAPAIAGTALSAALILALKNVPTLLGVPVGHSLTWSVPVGMVLALILGVLWAGILRATRPQVYAVIGLGPDAAAARTRSSRSQAGAVH